MTRIAFTQILVLIGFAFVILCCPPVSLAQVQMKVAYSAMTANNAPFWVAKDKGLFKKNGLDIDLIYIEGGSRLVAAMLAGDTPIVHVGATPIITAKLRGGDLVIIGEKGSSPLLALL